MNETIEDRVKRLEQEVKRLSQCHHVYEEVGGRNSNLRVFFNGTNSYVQCVRCGHRKRV